MTLARSLARPPLPAGPLSRSRLALAVKAAVASVLAWHAALLIPGAEEYSYFGPFGAVVAMTFNIAESLRQSVRAAVAIGLGCGLALVSELLIHQATVALGVLVLLGVLLAGSKWLGTMGLWIPLTAVLVLVVGGAQPGAYVAAYLGLTFLGGLIAVVVNIVLPPVPHSPIGPIDHRIRHRLAAYLDGMSAQLRTGHDEPDARTDWQSLAPLEVQLWDTADSTADARRVNLRASRYSTSARQQYAHARQLERLIHLTREVDELLRQRTDGTGSDLDEDTRRRVARPIASLARCLRRADGELNAGRADLAAASRTLRGVAVGESPASGWVLIGVVTAVRNSLLILVPDAFER